MANLTKYTTPHLHGCDLFTEMLTDLCYNTVTIANKGQGQMSDCIFVSFLNWHFVYNFDAEYDNKCIVLCS